MPHVRLFHWREDEARPLIAELRAEGFEVDYQGQAANGVFRSMREHPPLAAVIDLTRLPSHARYVAAELRGHKVLRQIPIVFVDGVPEKVEKLRQELPDAVYTSRARLATVLRKVKPPKDPVAPPRMMTRTDRTTAQKLNIRVGDRVAVIDAPPGYVKVIGVLPAGASLEEDPEETLPMTFWFVRQPEAYLAGLRGMRDRVGKTRLWVIYAKASSKKKGEGGITQFFVREQALRVGLVDYKICSLDATWTGMLFTRKK